jgi:hypothetical protein
VIIKAPCRVLVNNFSLISTSNELANVESLQVEIIQEGASACQQGTTALKIWKITSAQNPLSWQNSLCGWTSVQQNYFTKSTKYLDFPTRNSAISYCKRNNLEPKTEKQTGIIRKGSTIISGALRKESKPKSYGDNFSVQRKGTPIWSQKF